MLHTRVRTEFIDAFHTNERVQGLTHDFYKYPARFSPKFVRSVLELLTEPGDVVLDPFMGGGTTIVEAVATGRFAVGTDVNELGRFVTRAKTTPLSRSDVTQIREWVNRVKTTVFDSEHTSLPYGIEIRHLPEVVYPFFDKAIELSGELSFARRRIFARCALTRVGQWAIDGRLSPPEPFQLAHELERRVEQMIAGLEQFVSAANAAGISKNKITAHRKLSIRSAADSRLRMSLDVWQARPKLVLTSPPYPGVHVLYHRWQVNGRRETPAPYWISNLRDGKNEAYYTMGGRSESGQHEYFRKLLAAFTNVRNNVPDDATVVQLIAFADSANQLPRYLETMEAAGFREKSVGNNLDRLVRLVPNRKWYNWNRADNDASREVLLIHEPG